MFEPEDGSIFGRLGSSRTHRSRNTDSSQPTSWIQSFPASLQDLRRYDLGPSPYRATATITLERYHSVFLSPCPHTTLASTWAESLLVVPSELLLAENYKLSFMPTISAMVHQVRTHWLRHGESPRGGHGKLRTRAERKSKEAQIEVRAIQIDEQLFVT